MKTYGEAQSEALGQIGIRMSVPSMLERWSDFIDECEAGYQWDVSEYNQELGVRSALESLAKDERLKHYAEHSEVLNQLARLDLRFRELLIPNACRPGWEHWWESGILRRAGAAYADFMQQSYSIEVERDGD